MRGRPCTTCTFMFFQADYAVLIYYSISVTAIYGTYNYQEYQLPQSKQERALC